MEKQLSRQCQQYQKHELSANEIRKKCNFRLDICSVSIYSDRLKVLEYRRKIAHLEEVVRRIRSRNIVELVARGDNWRQIQN